MGATQPVASGNRRNPLVDIFSAHIRKVIYAVYAAIGLVLGSIQVWFGAVDSTTPTWMKGTLAVFAYVGGAIGITAASNTGVTR